MHLATLAVVAVSFCAASPLLGCGGSVAASSDRADVGSVGLVDAHGPDKPDVDPAPSDGGPVDGGSFGLDVDLVDTNDEPKPTTSPPPELPPPQPERAETPSSSFYGWQNLTGGYAGTAVALGSFFGRQYQRLNGGTAVGFVIFGLGSPVVHWAHGHALRGFAALGLNVVLPVVTGLIGSYGDHCTGHEECEVDLTPLYVGVTVGMLAAPVIDALTMGYEDAPIEPKKLTSAEPSTWHPRACRSRVRTPTGSRRRCSV